MPTNPLLNRASIHISLERSDWLDTKRLLFEYDMTAIEYVQLMIRLLLNHDQRTRRIIEEYVSKRLTEGVKKVRGVGNKFSSVNHEALYNLIEAENSNENEK